MAGLYIAVGAALCTVCSTGIASNLGPGFAKLVAGAVFPVGLIAIVLTAMELFTGDAMILPMSAMFKRITWQKVFYVWVLVYVGNFVGSLFWAYLMSVGPFVSHGAAEGAGQVLLNAFGNNAIAIAEAKTSYAASGFTGWWSCFMNGIGCNLLVNVAILLAFTSKNMIGKFFGIWFPIMAFVASGFEHCVANMYFIPAGIFLGADVTWGKFVFWNLVPCTIGNIIGGFLFIGVVYFSCFRKECSWAIVDGNNAA